MEVLKGALVEPSLGDWSQHTPVQFERLGYFVCDPDSQKDGLIFNRSVTLRDTWVQ